LKVLPKKVAGTKQLLNAYNNMSVQTERLKKPPSSSAGTKASVDS
jgi:hypothetical protein